MHRNRGKTRGVATAAGLLALWVASPATAVDDLSLVVSPGSQSVMPGDTVTVTLEVANLSMPINGVQALMQYDDTMLSLVSIVPTDLGLVLPNEGWVEVTFTDTGGAVDYAAVINGDSTIADGTVATLTFTAINEGTTSVTFRPGAPPFFTKLTVAGDNSTIFPNTFDSGNIVSTCDDGLFCNGVETFDGVTCQPATDPCVPLACDEVNDTCFAPVHIDGLEVFYAGRFMDQADTSRVFLAGGSTATAQNITNYAYGITGIRVIFDNVVDFASTPDAAFTFQWTTDMGTVFTPVTDPATNITVTSKLQGSVTVVTIVFSDDYLRQRWLEVTIDSTQITSAGVELDGELFGNPVILPSGDGSVGGDAVFYVGNMPGDINGDRKTMLSDVGPIRLQVNPALLVPIDNPYDVDKSGKVQLTDAGLARLDVNPAFVLPLISPP